VNRYNTDNKNLKKTANYQTNQSLSLASLKTAVKKQTNWPAQDL